MLVTASKEGLVQLLLQGQGVPQLCFVVWEKNEMLGLRAALEQILSFL